MNLPYLLRTDTGIRDWLHRLYSRGRAHGSELVEAIANHGDNCRTADLILEALKAEGWVIQDEKPTPTRTQLFAGVGGRTPGRKPNPSNAYAQEFGYTSSADLDEKLKRAGLWSV